MAQHRDDRLTKRAGLIPGAKRIPNLEQNAAACAITLTPAERETLERAFAPENVSGGRYPESFAAMAQR